MIRNLSILLVNILFLGVDSDGGIDVQSLTKNVTRIRKRFHDLMDDTFSLFGSSRGSPEENTRPTLIETKSHSAINSRYATILNKMNHQFA